MITRVLVVDDHRITREGLVALIEAQENMRIVGQADNGREAVRLVEKMKPDVVIMDISMPDLNGIDATRQVLSIAPRTKVVALSMYSDRRYVEGMLSAGVSGFLIKNCAFDELAHAINEVAAGKAYLCPGIADVVMKDFVRRRSAQQCGSEEDGRLTQREREILQLIAEGHGSERIAEELFISIKTVSSHRRKIMEKLDVHSVAELVKYALREGLTST